MADIEIGAVPVSLPRRSQSSWEVWTSKDNDSLGPHIILQHGVERLYITLTTDEVDRLQAWIKDNY